VDTGHTHGLDEAKFGTVPDRPGPVPQAEFAGPLADVWQTRLSIAYREVVKEAQRYHDADVAYIDMRRTGYPTSLAGRREHPLHGARQAGQEGRALVRRVPAAGGRRLPHSAPRTPFGRVVAARSRSLACLARGWLGWSFPAASRSG
jgi:hypothetical protein